MLEGLLSFFVTGRNYCFDISKQFVLFPKLIHNNTSKQFIVVSMKRTMIKLALEILDETISTRSVI